MSFLNEQPPRWAAKIARQVIAKGPAGGVYLTFDDGPDPLTTPRFLETLERLGCKATFFLLGHKVKAEPEIIRAIVESGHTVGIHGYEHKTWLWKSSLWVRGEIERTGELIEAAAGVKPKLLRPPYGKFGGSALHAAKKADMPLVLWSISTDDWNPVPVSELISRAVEPVSDGDIILLHDSGKGADSTLAALEGIIEGLRAKGLDVKELNM